MEIELTINKYRTVIKALCCKCNSPTIVLDRIVESTVLYSKLCYII